MLAAGTALKSNANFRDSCDFVVDPPSWIGNRAGWQGPAPVDAFIERLNEVAAGATVFVCTTLLADFFARAFALIPRPIVLVTGSSDWSAPGVHRHALENPKIIRWFSENGDLAQPHPKFEIVPLGLANPDTPHGNQATILRVHARMPAVEDKPLLAHASFHLAMSHASRPGAYEAIRGLEGVVLEPRRVPTELLWIRHAGHAFEISPKGAGPDCHRTWEALLLRSIPIVKRSPLDTLHEQFPIVIVDDWREISTAAMRNWRDRLQDGFTPEMFSRLTLDYWVDRIRTAAGR